MAGGGGPYSRSMKEGEPPRGSVLAGASLSDGVCPVVARWLPLGAPDERDQPRMAGSRSKRSRFMTLLQAATKSSTNFCLASSLA